jgi:hypothetical protein
MERSTDVRQYRTYNWAPPDAFSTGDPRLDNNRFFDERVRGQVEKQLASKGFEKATSGMPDLVVHYHASVTQEIDVRDFDQQYAYCDHADCRPYVYDAGTLFVDLVDPRTEKLVWRGWAEGSIEGVIDNQEFMEARIDETVRRILERLPRRL